MEVCRRKWKEEHEEHVAILRYLHEIGRAEIRVASWCEHTINVVPQNLEEKLNFTEFSLWLNPVNSLKKAVDDATYKTQSNSGFDS